MLRFLTIAPTVLCLTAGLAQAQIFGSEYDEGAPIRDGEQPMIPLATEDPTYNVWRKPLPSFEGQREGRELRPNAS